MLPTVVLTSEGRRTCPGPYAVGEPVPWSRSPEPVPGPGPPCSRTWPDRPGIARAVGIDPGPPPDGPAGEWRQVDVLDPGSTGTFAGVDAVAHLAVDLTPDPDRDGQRQRNTRAAQT